jgi:hypothetical protein
METDNPDEITNWTCVTQILKGLIPFHPGAMQEGYRRRDAKHGL